MDSSNIFWILNYNWLIKRKKYQVAEYAKNLKLQNAVTDHRSRTGNLQKSQIEERGREQTPSKKSSGMWNC